MSKTETYPCPQVRRHIVKTLGDLYTLAGYFGMHEVQTTIRTCEIKVLGNGRPPVRKSRDKVAHVEAQ
jgi:hypothetical protein